MIKKVNELSYIVYELTFKKDCNLKNSYNLYLVVHKTKLRKLPLNRKINKKPEGSRSWVQNCQKFRTQCEHLLSLLCTSCNERCLGTFQESLACRCVAFHL